MSAYAITTPCRILGMLFVLSLCLAIPAPRAHAATGQQEWAFDTGGTPYFTPAVADNGTIYVAGGTKIHALGPNGQKEWEFDTGGANYSTAVGPNGTIYACGNSKLFAIGANGLEEWQFAFGSTIYGPVAIATNGTIYVNSLDSSIYAIDPAGRKEWSFTTGDNVQAAPAIAANGTIYAASNDGKLYAVGANGLQEWVFVSGSTLSSSPAISGNGTIYFGDYGNRLYAIGLNGNKEWEFAAGGAINYSSPTIAANGTIYIGSTDKKLYAVGPNGIKEWEFATGGAINYSSPTIAANGTIYIGSEDGKLYAVGPNGIKEWEFATTGDIALGSPTLIANGTLYVGSYGSKLYALDGGNNGGLMQSAWPQRSQNNRKTGRDGNAISIYPGQTASLAFVSANATVMNATAIASAYNLTGFTPYTTLRAFKTAITPAGSTAVFRTSFTDVNGTIGSLALFKLFDASNSSAAFNAYAQAPDTATEKAWWITDADGKYLAATATLSGNSTYFVNYVVKDDGLFDADASAGMILDPVVLGSGGGTASAGDTGCTLNPRAGFSAELPLLFLFAPLAWLLRRVRR